MHPLIEAGNSSRYRITCVCVCVDPEGTLPSEDLLCSLFRELKLDPRMPRCLSYAVIWPNLALGCGYLGQQAVLISRKAQLSCLKASVDSGRGVKSVAQMSVILDMKVLSLESRPGVMVTGVAPIVKVLAIRVDGMCQDVRIISLNPHHDFTRWILSSPHFTGEEREARRCWRAPAQSPSERPPCGALPAFPGAPGGPMPMGAGQSRPRGCGVWPAAPRKLLPNKIDLCTPRPS